MSGSTPRPPLPSLRALTAELRETHEAWAHPIAGAGEVSLCLTREYTPSRLGYTYEWSTVEVGSLDTLGGELLAVYGRESIPGDGAAFDAVAAARRLLAAARDAGYR